MGKSTVVGELAERGFKAVDLDCDALSHWMEVGEDTALERPSMQTRVPVGWAM